MELKAFLKKHPSVIGLTVGLLILIFIAVTIITQQHSP